MRKFVSGITTICLFFIVFSPLSGQNIDTSLTFGGEVRARVRALDGIDFGDATTTSDKYLNLRGFIFADFNINNKINFHAQLLSASTIWKNDLSASDEDLLAVGELYTDIRFGQLPVQLRLGRQPLGYGSGRIIGASEGPNVAKKFDGLRTTVTLGKSTGDFVIASIVDYRQGVVDDRIGKDKIVYGSYWTIGLNDNKALDVYFFGNRLEDIGYNGTVADEHRYSIGSRFTKTGSLNFELEAVKQFGTYGDHSISAYMVSANVGYFWEEISFNPSVKFSVSMFSGKKDSTDTRIEVFRPVYARPPVNFMAPFGPSNMLLMVPEGSVEITSEVKVTFRYFLLWRLHKNDGLYNNQLSTMTRCSDTLSDPKGLFVTNGFNLSVAYNLTENLSTSFTGGYFFPGKYICNTGVGKAVKAGFVTATYAF